MWRVVRTSMALLLLASSSAWAESKCERRLAKARAADTDLRLEALDKAAQRCPDHPAILVATGEFLVEHRDVAERNWVGRAIDAFEQAVELDAEDPEARWGLASILFYAGYYEAAGPHFTWIAETGDISPERATQAEAHAVTSEFMSRVAEAPDVDLAKRMLWDVDLMFRSRFRELATLVAAVDLASRSGLAQEDDRQVQVAIGLLTAWHEQPSAQPVDERNRLLCALVDTFATRIHEDGLEEDVDELLAENGARSLGVWPDPGFAAESWSELEAVPPLDEVVFRIRHDLEISEAWDVPDLNGSWKCWLFNYKNLVYLQRQIFTVRQNRRDVEIDVRAEGVGFTFRDGIYDDGKIDFPTQKIRGPGVGQVTIYDFQLKVDAEAGTMAGREEYRRREAIKHKVLYYECERWDDEEGPAQDETEVGE